MGKIHRHVGRRSLSWPVSGYGPAREALEQADVKQDLSALLVIGDWKEAQQHIKDNPSILEDDGPYGAVIHVLAREGYTDAIRVLLESGVSPNRPWSRQYDHTPLYTATLFVEAGAHINPIEYAHLNTPLSWANYKGHKKIVDYLAQHGGTTHSYEFYVMP